MWLIVLQVRLPGWVRRPAELDLVGNSKDEQHEGHFSETDFLIFITKTQDMVGPELEFLFEYLCIEMLPCLLWT